MSSKTINRVAIVGRPNVGKSTLFNRLTRSRRAVVKNEPGVTRDISLETTEWWGHSFEIADTGGITGDGADFSHLIREKVTEFLEATDLIVFVVDGRTGLVPEDRDVFRLVKQSGRPFAVVVNKADRTLEPEMYLSDFYEFGTELIPAAFEQDFGIDVIVEWIIRHLEHKQVERREGVRLTIVGKPNAGKSSLCNQLLQQERMVVSSIAGTTVDAVETELVYNDKKYILVDTAGLRKASKQRDGVEALSTFKTRDSIHRADLVLLVVDAVEGPSAQDSRIIEQCLEQHKGIILVANKTDVARHKHENFREWFREQVAREFHFFTEIPLVFVSAKTGVGVDDLFKKIEEISEKLKFRISTSKLNKFFSEVIKQAPSPVWGVENVKFYYLVQTQQTPPSFIAFANHPGGVTPAYRRFLIRKIQEEWGLKGIPIRIFVLPKGAGGRRRPREDNATEALDSEGFDTDVVETSVAEAGDLYSLPREIDLGELSDGLESR